MSIFGTSFKFGTGVRFGSSSLDADCLAIARSIMQRFHSELVVNKESEDTPQFGVVLALAQAICTMKEEAIASRFDNFLSTSRAEHIQDVWTPMLGVPYAFDKTLAENIEFYQNLIKVYMAGTEFDGLSYQGVHAINIIGAIYFFSMITGVRIFEAWRDFLTFFGTQYEAFELGSPTSLLGGLAVLGPSGNAGRTGQVRAGIQVVVPLDNYAGPNTDPIVAGAKLMRPLMADLVIIYSLLDITFAGGVDPGVTQIAWGRGTQDVYPLPSTLAFEVYRTPVFQTYVDAAGTPVPYVTTRKRYFGIMDREMVFGDVPITEAALIDGSGVIQNYRTFSAINKTDLIDVLMGWTVDFT